MRATSLTRKKRRGKTRPHKEKYFFMLALVLCILVLLAGMRFLGSFQALQNKEEWAKKLRQAPQTAGTNCLLFGLVRNGEETTVEEIFFLNFPPAEASFHTVFIPGKVLLHRLGNGNDVDGLLKGENGEEAGIQSFYTPDHFYQEGGAELLIQQISHLLDAPIHHYLEFDYSGIPTLVDDYGLLASPGGVGDVVKGRDYYASLMQGQGETGGELSSKALCRMSFLGDLLKFLSEKKGKLDLYRTVCSVSSYFKTDLTWKELGLFREDLEPFFQAENLMISLPGTWHEFDGELFLEPDNLQLAALIENLGEGFILPREMITVEVLNGSGAAGVASIVGSLLEEQGFQIVKIDNADNFEYQRSQVVSRLEQVEPAKEVALFVPEAELYTEFLPDHTAMVTVIIGKNFRH